LIDFLTTVSQESDSLKPIKNIKNDYDELNSSMKDMERRMAKLKELLQSKEIEKLLIFDEGHAPYLTSLPKYNYLT